MKTKTIGITLISMLAVTALVFQSCKPDDLPNINNQNETLEIEAISGTVILPNENQLNPDLLTIQSVAGSSEVVNNEFEINIVKNETNTIYAVDDIGKVVLMGYNYPNQINNNIDSESTLIAMIMSLPLSQTLSIDGKVNFINAIKQDPEFQNLKVTLENNLNQGTSPLDTSQENFALDLISFFEDNVNRNSSNILGDRPVKIFQQNREFIFQNPGKMYSCYIGVYKDNQRLESIKLDRVKFVPTSISQILVSILDNITNDVDIVEQPYTLPSENGEYEIRIRTGRQFTSVDDKEAALALVSNITDLAMDIFFDLMSFENPKLECTQLILGNFKTFLGSVDDFQNINSTQDVLTFTYDKTLAFIISSENTIVSGLCTPPNVSITNYLKAIEKKIYWLKWIGILGNTGNMSIGAWQWFTDEAIMDECYSVNGNNVTDCDPLLGEWEAFELGGIPVGTWEFYYDYDECPNIITTAYRVNVQTLNITATELIHSNEVENRWYNYINLDDYNCTYDSFTIETEPYGGSWNISYSHDENTLTFYDVHTGDYIDVLYEIQNNNTLILSDEYGDSKYHRK